MLLMAIIMKNLMDWSLNNNHEWLLLMTGEQQGFQDGGTNWST